MAWVVIAIFFLLALIAGLVAAKAKLLILALFVGAGVGIVLLFQPTLLLWVVLVGALLVTGLAELYLPALRQIRWGVVLGGIALGATAILTHMVKRKTGEMAVAGKLPNSVLFFALAFFLIACFSSFMNDGASATDIIGLKGYFQVWGLLLFFVFADPGRFFVHLRAFLLWLSVLQVPFALQQYLVLVPQRSTEEAMQKFIVPVDIVVGTFVGSMGGGGASSSLAFLQVISITFLFALWRAGKIRPIAALSLSAFFFIPMLLNETKVTFLALPIALGLLYKDAISRNFFRTVLAVFMMALLLSGVFVGYALQQSVEKYGPRGPGEYWDEVMAYNTGKKGYGTFRLNRTTVYLHWFDHHAFFDIRGMLIGHGAGESVEIDPTGASGLRDTSLAARRYPRDGIGLTGLSTLLWDVGLVGAIAVIGIFWGAFRFASRITVRMVRDVDWALLKSAEAGVAILGLSLLLDAAFAFEIGYQTLLMLMLGIIIYYGRRTSGLNLSDMVADDQPAPLAKSHRRSLALARLKKR
ncbi:MAG: hypothetical protein ACSLE5_15420 [Porticoccaceae bacterium]